MTDTETVMKLLRKVPLFANLKDEDKVCIEETEEWRLPADEMLVEEGKHAEYFFVLLEGEMSVWKKHAEQDVVVARNRPGAFFGEVPRHGTPYMLSGRAERDCRLIVFPEEAFWPREVGQLWHLRIDGEPIRDEREHGGDGDAHLRRGVVRLDPKHGPRHHHDEDQRDDDLDHVVVRIARSGELEGITGNLNSRGDAVRFHACAGGNHSPVLNRQLFREADSLAHPGGERHRVGGELDLFRSISEHDDLHAEGVAVEREGAQIQRLREGADQPLPIRRRAIGRHFGDLGSERTTSPASFAMRMGGCQMSLSAYRLAPGSACASCGSRQRRMRITFAEKVCATLSICVTSAIHTA